VSILIYPQLAAHLERRHLTVAELSRQIEQRYGLAVDAQRLDYLTQTAPLQQADLQIAGAAAAILGLKLDDLFLVAAIPNNGTNGPGDNALPPTESKRLSDLFARKREAGLTDEEGTELDTLIAAYGRRLHEQNLRELAQRGGVSIEAAERESAAQIAEALDWWEAHNARLDGEAEVAETAAEGQAR
jgi:hypothetical protein